MTDIDFIDFVVFADKTINVYRNTRVSRMILKVYRDNRVNSNNHHLLNSKLIRL